jgi:cobalt transporter subunit CbtB
MNVQTQSAPIAAAGQKAEALKAAAIAFFVGAALVFTAGFSHSSAMHNAGHDTRHTLAFPCH